MKEICYALMLLLCPVLFVQAQNYEESPTEAMQSFHEKRFDISTPPYGLSKVQRLIADMEKKEQGKLSATAYNALSLREKFTYHMLYGESYSQICDVFPLVKDESKKIFGNLQDAFGEHNWSDRQTNFLLNNKDSVIKWMKECIQKDKKVGLNFKHAIVDINATAMIPFLISTYQTNSKDHDILTVLLLLMKDNKYPPFLTSVSHKKLYGDEAEYYEAHILYNSANVELVIKRATDFYNGLQK